LINGDNYEIWLFLGAGITHDILVKFMLDNKINMQICQNSIENQ
jgi:hypothetical protein